MMTSYVDKLSAEERMGMSTFFWRALYKQTEIQLSILEWCYLTVTGIQRPAETSVKRFIPGVTIYNMKFIYQD